MEKHSFHSRSYGDPMERPWRKIGFQWSGYGEAMEKALFLMEKQFLLSDHGKTTGFTGFLKSRGSFNAPGQPKKSPDEESAQTQGPADHLGAY